MGITLAYASALHAIRALRKEGVNIRQLERTYLRIPEPWVGNRWSMKEFAPEVWRWHQPSFARPLEVMTPTHTGRIRMQQVESYQYARKLPFGSIIRLDGISSVVSPELLFVQMAAVMSLPATVMLGYELCGHFARDANDPLFGKARIDIPAATSVERIREMLGALKGVRGMKQARRALNHVSDHALSPPEAVLGTMGSLPAAESGYALGSVTLNERVVVDDKGVRARHRYPDLLFSFAPVGINYDGQEHLDLAGLVRLAKLDQQLEGDERREAAWATAKKIREIRSKVLDDTARNNELMARGYAVMVATKEDLETAASLDRFVKLVLECAKRTFDVDTSTMLRRLESTDAARDRASLLRQISPVLGAQRPDWGKL